MGILEVNAIIEAAERACSAWAKHANQTPPELSDELSRLAQKLATAGRGQSKVNGTDPRQAHRIDPRQGGPL